MNLKSYINSAFLDILTDKQQIENSKGSIKFIQLKSDKNSFKKAISEDYSDRICGEPKHYIDLLL